MAGIVLPEFFAELSPAQHKMLEKTATEYARFLDTQRPGLPH